MAQLSISRWIRLPLLPALFLALSLVTLVAAFLAATPIARAGGAGTLLPPPPLPVRAAELRVQLQARMVCVADPGIVCDAPYLDAGSNSTTTDGGVFRSTSCPGANPPGACRPDYIAGAELTGELVDTWDVTIVPIDGATFDSCNGTIQTCILSSPPAGCVLPPPGTPIEIDCEPPSIGGSDNRLICHGGKLEFNLTAPGVAVSNPLVSLDPLDLPGTDFKCDEEGNGGAFPFTFGGERIEPWWITRQFGATCDIALEYSLSFLPRDQIRAIGQQAFPAQLCDPDGMGVCRINPEPVFVEPDGSLTKGCGTGPSNTFTIRFAQPNEPLTFVSQSVPTTPLAVRDVDADGDLDLIGSVKQTLHINDGSNLFTAQPSGLSPGTLVSADVGDWTNDGNVDLVTRTGSATTVFPGNGAGSFGYSGTIAIDAVANTRLELADMNGDGLPDAVAHAGGTRVIYNQTGGPIAPAIDTLSIAPYSVTDVDGDTSPDILSIVESNPPRIDVGTNTGPGDFPESLLFEVPSGIYDFFNAPEEIIPLLGQDVYAGVLCEVPPATSDCCEDNGSPGCDDTTCEATVCGMDSFCCSEWDQGCANIASIACANICPSYQLECEVRIDDVTGGDVDADGDADVFFSFDLQQRMLANGQNYSTESRWIAWLPNLQVDDPVGSGGSPYFDVATESWRLLGRAPAVSDEFESETNGPSEIHLVDLDGDSDLDVVAVGLWYRNEGGTFSGPHAMKGELTRPARPDVLFVDDLDDDGHLDVVTADRLWTRVPEPGTAAMLVTGIIALLGFATRRAE